MRMILPHGWVRRNSTKDFVDTSVEITGIINLVLQKKTANIWGHINSVSGRGKRSSVDGIQPVEFQSFLLKKVESARNSIRARENPIYLVYAQEGGLSRLQDVDEDELLKAIQRLPNKQCASDPIPTWLLKRFQE